MDHQTWQNNFIVEFYLGPNHHFPDLSINTPRKLGSSDKQTLQTRGALVYRIFVISQWGPKGIPFLLFLHTHRRSGHIDDAILSAPLETAYGGVVWRSVPVLFKTQLDSYPRENFLPSPVNYLSRKPFR